MREKARFLIDADGVIVDFVEAFMMLYRHHGGTVPDGFEWTHWDSMDELPDQEVRKHVWRDPELFWVPRPYEGAIEALEILNEHYDVRIVTALPHRHVPARSEWFRRYAPFIHRKNQMIFTNDKRIIKGDAIVDDKLEHVYNWLHANGGTGFIINRPWNGIIHDPPLGHMVRGNKIRVDELMGMVELLGMTVGRKYVVDTD